MGWRRDFTVATKIVSGWAAKAANLRLLVLLLVIVLSWIVLWLADSSELPGPIKAMMEEGQARAVWYQDHADVEAAKSKAGPGLTAIDFDDHTLEITNTKSPVTSRRDIAAILDWIGQSGGAKPLFVYVDVGIPQRAPDEQILAAALARWAHNPSAPVLAIAAGTICASSPDDPDGQSFFDPKPYNASVQPDQFGKIGPSAKIFWSCPMIDQGQEAQWSCTYSLRSIALALPSAGLLMDAVHRHGANAARAISNGLATARDSCARDERPPHIRIRFNFNPNNSDTLTGRGEKTFRHVSASYLLSNRQMSHESIAGRIVTIGASNSWSKDVKESSFGELFGATIVGEALRSAWIYGQQKKEPLWRNGLVATAVILILFGTLSFSKFVRHTLRPSSGALKFMVFVVTHTHVLSLFFLTLAILIIVAFPLLLPDGIYIEVAAVLFLVEIMVVLDAVLEDWRHEKN